MIWKALLITSYLVGTVYGHSIPSTPFSNHPEEISRRQLEANARHVLARNCAPQVAEYQAQRKARRELRRRGIIEDGPMDLNKRQTATSSALTPHYSTIQNFTCIVAPQGEEEKAPIIFGTISSEPTSREGQAGTPLYLDIGVLDITTCTPATDVFVEVWNCNAQGTYSGFGSTGTGGGGGGGGGGPSSGKTDTYNFLRGGYKTNDNGVAEFLTIYPGFYSGRTIHVHAMVHQGIQTSSNGTIISSSGSLRHIGQIFFDEAVNTEVLAQTEYAANGRSHTLNAQDRVVAAESINGYNAFASVTKLGSTLSDGLLGYITIGIDTNAIHTISTKNYYGPVKRAEEKEDNY